jgi:hypothetical protein
MNNDYDYYIDIWMVVMTMVTRWEWWCHHHHTMIGCDDLQWWCMVIPMMTMMIMIVLEQILYDCEKVTVRTCHAMTMMVPCLSILIGWEVLAKKCSRSLNCWLRRFPRCRAVTIPCAVVFHTHTKSALVLEVIINNEWL